MTETNVEQLKTALNIDREPFSDEGVSGLFFPGGGRQEAVDQLLHLCRYGPSLLFLLGENGVGKSIIIRQLESALDPSVFSLLHFDADVLDDERQLLDAIETGFNVDLGDHEDAAFQALARYSRELESYSQTPLVIIDEAQNLSASAVAFLQRLLHKVGGAGLRCLLVSDGESLDKIPLLQPFTDSGLDQQVLRVSPLNEQATSDYLAYRMTTSGLGDIQFSTEQMRQIYHQSMGVIDRINMTARQILVNRFPYQRNQKKPFKLPVLHLLLVALLGAVLLLSFLWVPDEQTPLVALDERADQVAKQPSGLDQLMGDKRMLTPDNSDHKTIPGDSSETDVTQVVTNNPQNTKEEVAPPADQALDSFVATEKAVDFNYVEEGEDSEVLQPVKPSAEAVKAKPATEEKVTKASVALESKQVVPNDFTPREQWLLSLNKEKYTLQMLGAREEASVQKFLAKYPSLKDIAYYKTRHRNKDWFVVVYGQFPSKESAKQALSKLPNSLQQSKPWPRPMADIQAEIRRRK